MLGGNSGLGVETARALAHAGARVIVTSRKVSAGEDVVAKLRADGVQARIFICFGYDAVNAGVAAMKAAKASQPLAQRWQCCLSGQPPGSAA